MAIAKELLDELLKDCNGPDGFRGPDGPAKQLSKALVERAMQAGLTEQLGYEKSESGEKQTGNRRNGKTSKTLRTDQGPMEIEVPRDRNGGFEPKAAPKRRRERRGFDGKTLSAHGLGLPAKAAQENLKDIYNAEVSPELISRVTDEVKGPVGGWRNRPLEPFYPVIFFDALRVNIRSGGHAAKKAVYSALAVRLDGQKEMLGMRTEQSEGAKFRTGMLNELKNRGVNGVLTAAAGGLAGFPDAANAVFPNAEVRSRTVRTARGSVKYISYKDRGAAAAGLKETYPAPSEDAAGKALDRFSEKRGVKYPVISKSWRNRRNGVIPFMKFSPEIRKAAYTANAVESINYNLQRSLKTRQSFPNDEPAMKIIFMILRRISKKRAMPIRNRGEALNQFALVYGDRVPL